MTGADVTIKDILNLLQNSDIEFEYQGDMGVSVVGVSAITNYKEGTISWIRDQATQIRNDVFYYLLVAPFGISIKNSNILHCQEPRNVFSHILTTFFVTEPPVAVSNTAMISRTALIGGRTSIGEYCVIGENVIIGSGCKIEHFVSIGDNVVIGDRCTIKSGAQIGGDGFGYYNSPSGRLERIPHLGGIRIGDRVDIGSNTCIDRVCLAE